MGLLWPLPWTTWWWKWEKSSNHLCFSLLLLVGRIELSIPCCRSFHLIKHAKSTKHWRKKVCLLHSLNMKESSMVSVRYVAFFRTLEITFNLAALEEINWFFFHMQAENIKFTLEQQMVFFARLVGHFEVADEVTPVKIDNFDWGIQLPDALHHNRVVQYLFAITRKILMMARKKQQDDLIFWSDK